MDSSNSSSKRGRGAADTWGAAAATAARGAAATAATTDRQTNPPTGQSRRELYAAPTATSGSPPLAHPSAVVGRVVVIPLLSFHC